MPTRPAIRVTRPPPASPRLPRSARLTLSAALAPLLLPPSPLALADTKTWTGPPGGSWALSSNWSPAGAPASNDAALFSLSPSSAYSVTFNGDFIVGTTFTSLSSLTLDATGTSPFTLLQNISASDMRAATETIGDTGRATYAQSAATNGAQNLYLGYNAASTGAYQLTGGTLNPYYTTVGYSGYGSFTQSGGIHAVAYDLTLAANPGSSATYSLSSFSSLSAATQYVGYSGDASFSQTAGTNTISTNAYVTVGPTALYLGYNAGATGSYSLSGGRLTTSGNEYVGYSGSGTLVQSNGAINSLSPSSSFLSIAHLAGSSGTYSLGPSTYLGIPSAEYVGYAGSGTFIQSGGTHSLTGSNAPANGLFLAYSPSSSGTYLLSGGSLATTNNQYIGYAGSGSVVQSASARNILTGTGVTLYLGYGAGATGSYSLSGTLTSVNAPALVVGHSGTGSITHTGGYIAVSSLTLGANRGASGSYSLSGTAAVSLTASSAEYIGYAGSGTFTQSGGAHVVGSNSISGTLYLGYSPAGTGSYTPAAAGSYVLSGGSLSAPNEIIGYLGAGTFIHTGGTHTSQNLTLASGISSTGAYSLSDAGSLSTYLEIIGDRGDGTFVQSGGSNSATFLYLGNQPTSKGTYVLQGGSLYAANLTYGPTSTLIQTGGSLIWDSFNQTGGSLAGGAPGSPIPASLTLTTPPGSLTGTSTGTHSYALSGSGSLTLDALTLDSGGRFTLAAAGTLSVPTPVDVNAGGTLTMTGGTFSVPAINVNAGGTFTYTGGTLNAPSLNLAPGARGVFNSALLDSGTPTIPGAPMLHADPASTLSVTTAYLGTAPGSYSLTLPVTPTLLTNTLSIADVVGSTAAVSLSPAGAVSIPTEYVGRAGAATVTQSAGTHTVSTYLALGFDAGSTGTYSLSGASALLSPRTEDIGRSGAGTFVHSAGAHSFPFLGTLNLGANPGSTGTYSLSGTGSLSVDTLNVGFQGAGSFDQTGGSVAALLKVAASAGSTGTYSLSAGTLTASSETIGAGGTFLQTGGSNTVTGNLAVTGTYALSAGNLTVGSLSFYPIPQHFLWTGGTLSVTAAPPDIAPAAPFGSALKLSPGMTYHVTALPNISPLCYLDISGGTLIVSYTGTSPLALFHTYLQNGQIRSTAADANHVLAYVDSASTLTALLTLPGDANMDGSITPDDYALLDRGFAKHLTGWTTGDFNYDGTINSQDYLAIDRSYLLTHPSSAPDLLAQRDAQFGDAYVQQLVAAVPEPAPFLPWLLPLACRRRTRRP